MTRELHEIAVEIRDDWTPVYFGAVPYLAAMRYLGPITDTYGQDTARDIVTRFLTNATTWRGPVARRVKIELREMSR